MRVAERINVRLAGFAALALAFAIWALDAVAPHDTGTLERPGPAMVPSIAAVLLIAVALPMLVRALTGWATAPPRLMPAPWRLGLALALILLVVLPELLALLGGLPPVAALRAYLREEMLSAGPADWLVLAWLRWTLAIALGVVLAGEGLLSGTASLLVGAVVALSGVDPQTGISRMLQLDSLMEELPWAVEIGVLVLMFVCRVNPLPAVLTYAGALAAEEMFRRTMILAKGDLLPALLARPVSLAALAGIVAVAAALAWYRWPWRAADQPPRVVA